MSSLAMSWLFDKKPSVVGAATGAVAGLVAITPAAGFVGPLPAIIIGLGAGAVCYGAVKLLAKLKVDDSLAVWGVHGIGGAWGALATGLFVGIGFAALAEGVSRWEQILYQLIGIGASAGWAERITVGSEGRATPKEKARWWKTDRFAFIAAVRKRDVYP